MNKMIGRATTTLNLLPLRSVDLLLRICRSWASGRRSRPRYYTLGQRFLNAFFAFTARCVQTTTAIPQNERRQRVYHSKLSENGPGRGAAIMLPDRILGDADRSGLRGSTTVRRFSHHLLHRLGTGIL